MESKDYNNIHMVSTSPTLSDDNGIEVEHNPVSDDLSEEYEFPIEDSSSRPNMTATQKPENNNVSHDLESIGRKRFFSTTSENESNQEVAAVRRIAPQVNCKEKIIFCIDMSKEMDEVPFRLGDGSRYSPLYMAKRVIEVFVCSKARIDRNHEYALVLLDETGHWCKDFMSDPKEVGALLDELMETTACQRLDLSSLFEIIESRVALPLVQDPEVAPPPYVVRTILIYGRSYCIPTFSTGRQALSRLYQSHYFFVDILYIHVTPNENNSCQDVFDTLCELDEKGMSYVLEVSRNPTKLHDSMAKLLAHPLQRALQRDVCYRLENPTTDL